MLKRWIREYEEKEEKEEDTGQLWYAILDLLESCDLTDPWILDKYIKYQKEKVEQYAGAWGDIEAEGQMYDLHELYLLKGDLDKAISALDESADMCERWAKSQGQGDDEYSKMIWDDYTGRAKYRREVGKKYRTMTEAELNKEKKEILKRREEASNYLYSLTSVLKCIPERIYWALRSKE